MADIDRSIYGKLKRLFASNAVVRRVGGRLKVIDVNRLQGQGALDGSRYVDRFSRLHGGKTKGMMTNNNNYNYHASKTEIYTDYEAMDKDGIISSALDIYADETTMKNEMGDVLEISSDNIMLKKLLENLFYDVLNIEFNLWSWARNLCKYGDFYLYLNILPEIGIVNAVPLSSYDISRIEGQDPENPYAYKFEHKLELSPLTNKKEFESFEMAHFRLLSDSNFLPYGRSMLEPGRKLFKQLTLMEDAVLIHRVMRAPEKRVFKIDIGNIPPQEVDAYMKKVIDESKKIPFVDQSTGDYNLKYNMQNILEDFYVPVRGGQSGTEIETLQGLVYNGMEDVEYLQGKMFAALKIPKAFLGYDDNVNAKATLAAEDVRFARTIERIQKILISELTKIAITHLFVQGYRDENLINFEIKMKTPSIIFEQEKVNLFNQQIALVKEMKEGNVLPSQWYLKNIMNFSDSEIEKFRLELKADAYRQWELDQLETTGTIPDPLASEGEEEENPEDIDGNGVPDDEEDHLTDPVSGEAPEDFSDLPFGGSHEGGQEGAGRPTKPIKHGSIKHPRGEDPIGKKHRIRGFRKDFRIGKESSMNEYENLITELNRKINGKDENKDNNSL